MTIRSPRRYDLNGSHEQSVDTLEESLANLRRWLEPFVDRGLVEAIAPSLQEVTNWLHAKVIDAVAGEINPEDPLTDRGRLDVAYALVMYVCAEQARAAGDHPTAWYWVARARYHEGMFEENFILTRKHERLASAGRKGGQISSTIRSPLKRECMRLLESLRPKDGWPSSDQAVEVLTPHLIEFNEREVGETMSAETLRTRVKSYLKAAGPLRDAYLGVTPGLDPV